MKIFAIAGLAGALLIGGCSTAQIEQTLSAVQTGVDALCNFVPTVDTIVGEINAAAGAAAQTVTNNICEAVQTVSVAPATSGSLDYRVASLEFAANLSVTPPPSRATTRNGTPVHGYWSRGKNAGKRL